MRSTSSSMPAAASESHAHFIELPELDTVAPVGPALLSNPAGLLDSFKVSLSVVVGEVHTTLGELMGLKQQAVLKVDRQVDTPVDVMVNGKVVARGQLVVVDDSFGVRITAVAPASRG
jgi:flagellar motor switch protein FliN/FliY